MSKRPHIGKFNHDDRVFAELVSYIRVRKHIVIEWSDFVPVSFEESMYFRASWNEIDASPTELLGQCRLRT